MEAARLSRARVRRETGKTLLEGPHSLAAAVGVDMTIETIFALSSDLASRQLAEQRGLPIVLVTPEVLAKVADTETPRGPVAVMHIPQPAHLTDDRVLVLADVSDPGNLGTMIRTAAAFGFDVSVAGGADLWSPKTLRAAASAHFQTRLSWSRSLDIESLKSAGYRVVASVVEGGRTPHEVAMEARRDALLIGSEAHGLPADAVRRSDALVTIPMPGGTESLNAAVSASILMYAWSAAQ